MWSPRTFEIKAKPRYPIARLILCESVRLGRGRLGQFLICNKRVAQDNPTEALGGSSPIRTLLIGNFRIAGDSPEIVNVSVRNTRIG